MELTDVPLNVTFYVAGITMYVLRIRRSGTLYSFRERAVNPVTNPFEGGRWCQVREGVKWIAVDEDTGWYDSAGK